MDNNAEITPADGKVIKVYEAGYPTQPFLMGYRILSRDDPFSIGIVLQQSLKDEEIRLIEHFTDQKWDGGSEGYLQWLRIKLETECGVSDASKWTWPEILLRIAAVYQKRTETAASDNKADVLTEKPAETEQKTVCAKIKAGFWNLYEVTLKVIVDAVMERVWPKRGPFC
jgi:hypothetical protein